MDYNEFIRRVQERADLPSREAAVELTKATLATLGERLYRTTRDNLAAQLDNDLKPYLGAETDPVGSRKQLTPFDLENFFGRVSGRADMSVAEAARHAPVVIGVLQEAVSAGQWEAVTDELPDEYSRLWSGKPSGIAHARDDETYEVDS